VTDLVDVVNDSASITVNFRNLEKVRAQGMEVALDVRPAHRLQGYLSYSIGRAVDDDTGSRLTNSPDHLLKLGLAAEVAPRVSAATELRYESGRTTVTGTRTEPFLIANLNLGFHPFGRTGAPGAFGRLTGFDLSLRVTNLFDTRYAYPGGTEHVEPAIEQDGRAVMVRLGYEF
jgi:outer membrane receptor protein involved in Fe transport